MDQKITILEGYSGLEKGAYLGAIASISTADRSASEEELSYIEALCASADLTEEQTGLIMSAANEKMSDEELKRCLDVLKGSELRFSLVSDVIAFAESDQSYSEEEQQAVHKMATYLGVNQDQFSLLDQFTKKAVKEAPNQSADLGSDNASSTSFLDKLGFGDKLKKAGIDGNSLIKGALGILGPIFLAKMLSGRSKRGGMMGGNSNSMGGGLLGGLLGGGGGLLGGLLGGGRGFGGAGGLLGRIFGRRM